MLRGRLRIGVLVLAGLAAACAPHAQITAVKAPDYAGDPKRLSVIESMGPALGDTYLASFQTRLQDAVRDCGLEADFIVRPPAQPALSLDNGTETRERRAEGQRIQQFKPDAVLGIVAKSYVANEKMHATLEVTYVLDLVDMRSRKTVWKAEVVMRPGLGEGGAPLANDIVARLAKDGILRHCPGVA
jgi:hypothetical protein